MLTKLEPRYFLANSESAIYEYHQSRGQACLACERGWLWPTVRCESLESGGIGTRHNDRLGRSWVLGLQPGLR